MLTALLISLLAFAGYVLLQYSTARQRRHASYERSLRLEKTHVHNVYAPPVAVLRFLSKSFLYSFVASFLLRFQKLRRQVAITSQIAILHIRQALNETHYGRGLLHS